MVRRQGPPDKRAGLFPDAQGKERKEKVEEKKGRNFFSVPGSGFEPATLTLEDKAPVFIATITLHKDRWLQLLYKITMKDIL